jgi:predicted nucleic acid-binding protein
LILYLDTSALVTLYVSEETSARARRTTRRADQVVTSLLAYPETLAAFSRRAREGTLTTTQHDAAGAAFRAAWSSWSRIPLDKRLLPEISRLLKLYPLRGGDAVHLASAVLVRRRLSESESDDEILFACNDEPLRRAAEADGFRVAW